MDFCHARDVTYDSRDGGCRTRRGLREHRSVGDLCRALRNTGLPDIEWLVVVDPRPDRGQSRDESHDCGSPNGQLRDLLETVVRSGTHTGRGNRRGIDFFATVVAGACSNMSESILSIANVVLVFVSAPATPVTIIASIFKTSSSKEKS